jgi:RNA polymerase sigma-32 factor
LPNGSFSAKLALQVKSRKSPKKSRKGTTGGAIAPVRPQALATGFETSQPVLSDPLKQYLRTIRNSNELSPDEETRLARRLVEKGDVDAAKTLVSANLKTVVRIAYEYRSIYTNLMDLIQEGNIGLMKAVSKFDPDKGARLAYYATWWIRSYILKYILDNFRLVRVGTSAAQKKLFYHLVREKQRLEAQGIFPGPKLLAKRLDVKEKDIIEMEQRMVSSNAEVSIDAPIGGEYSGFSLSQTLVDPTENLESRISREQWLALLEKELPELRKTLNDRERVVLEERLLAEEPKTLQEVADRYGLTRERVRQIETGVIAKLRAAFKGELESS